MNNIAATSVALENTAVGVALKKKRLLTGPIFLVSWCEGSGDLFDYFDWLA